MEDGRAGKVVTVFFEYRTGSETVTIDSGLNRRDMGFCRIMYEVIAEEIMMSEESPKINPDSLMDSFQIFPGTIGEPRHFRMRLDRRYVPESFLEGKNRRIRIFPGGRWEAVAEAGDVVRSKRDERVAFREAALA